MPQGEQCPFCQLVDSPEQTFDVHETENFKAWLDINPRARGHTMIVPKDHLGGMEDIDGGELFNVVQTVAVKARKALGASGVSIVINDGESAGQRLDHFYVQVFPRFEGEENEGAPAGAVFQPMEEVEEEQLEDWSESMASVDVDMDEGPEGPAKEMFERKREGKTGEESSKETRETQEEGKEGINWEDRAEFK